MKLRFVLGCIISVVVLTAVSCGTNVNLTNPSINDSLGVTFGTDETLDIITWNIQSFPKHNPETTDLLKTIIPNLKVELIAMQEISSTSSLNQLISQIPNWSSIVSGSGDGYTRVGILYNNLTVQIDSMATIFADMSTPFPRAPLLVKINWQGQEIIVINVHLKAYDDNNIVENDPHDNEYRRKYACQLLDQYIITNFPASKVIILGDMNDQIQDPEDYNVFMSFLNKPEEYYFTDMPIAINSNVQNCSYPKYGSQIDHILITNELYEAYDLSNRYVKAINIENYVAGGLSGYYTYISDHRPVGARFKF